MDDARDIFTKHVKMNFHEEYQNQKPFSFFDSLYCLSLGIISLVYDHRVSPEVTENRNNGKPYPHLHPPYLLNPR